MRAALPIATISLLLAFAASAATDEGFDYGPFDYTNPEDVRTKLPVVEQYHFNRDIETLTDTMPGGSVGAHLWYVIRSFPNHHRALVSYSRLWRESLAKGSPPSGVTPDKTPDYVLQRAMDFAPGDAMVPLIYGLHLIETGKKEEARALLERAASLDNGQPELSYNLGLAYVKLGEYSTAARFAERAYAMNYPLPGLRNRLIAVGAWPAKSQ
jgi:tetratricopeptide (TPR) repeat protein